MAVKLGVVMDPISSVNFKKDTTLAMLLDAAARGWELYYMELGDLFLRDGRQMGRARALEVMNDPLAWYELGDQQINAGDLDVVLMRKDPPFDMEYVYATYMLERLEIQGVTVVNKPSSLRDVNEKMYTAWFPQCCPPTLVSRNRAVLHDFLDEHQDIVVKPLDGMGGVSIFRVSAGSPNINVIFETITSYGARYIMAQRYVPEIKGGDKRVLLIEGEPVPYALARVPSADDHRGNLAAGAAGVGVELGERERWIAKEVGATLREKGLTFVGLDIIGDYLTEINVTSPTCLRELEALYDIPIAKQFNDAVERRFRGN